MLRWCKYYGRSKKSSPRKTFASMIGFFVVCCLYHSLNEINYSWYRWRRNNPVCIRPKEDMQDLIHLIQVTHGLLNEQNLTHFLVYGSLWGALRYNDPLPWDSDFDFGLFHDQLLKTDEDLMIRAFISKGVNIFYRPYFGLYRVEWKRARGDLMVFRDFDGSGIMNRVGWESYLFFVNYRRFHSFPASLVRLPLPNTSFAGKILNIPHFGIEIQKYHYPYDWWKETKPIGC